MTQHATSVFASLTKTIISDNSQPAHAFFGKAIYKVTVKVFSTGVGEEILYFFGLKALRKGIKDIECLINIL